MKVKSDLNSCKGYEFFTSFKINSVEPLDENTRPGQDAELRAYSDLNVCIMIQCFILLIEVFFWELEETLQPGK